MYTYIHVCITLIQQITHRTYTHVYCRCPCGPCHQCGIRDASQVGLRDLHQSGCSAECWDYSLGQPTKMGVELVEAQPGEIWGFPNMGLPQ